jgi:hypothetical protein
MTEPIERDLRDIFQEDARRAPMPGALAETVIRHERRRRIRRLTTAGVTVASVGTLFVLWQGPIGMWWEGRAGATASRCVAGYSPTTAVNQRAFSFDGTVTTIGEPYDDTDQARSGNTAVTFAVNEWFRGGSGPTVTVDMDTPHSSGWGPADGRTPTYAVGRRLLVSGDPRRGGLALSGLVAWGCGFTRPYTADAADLWRGALRVDRP